jgi:C4-dicarboxylate-specific signal transduction histidine kinase
MRGEPCLGEDGRIAKWCGTYTDIHDMKQAEQVMLRGELLALAGRMAARVAHEINNPLEAVGNLLYLATTNTDIVSVRGYLEKAEAEVNRVAYITRQSLGFYSESSAPAPCWPRELLKSAIELLLARIAAKQAVIDIRWGYAL